jgi:hypothetical protein
MVVRRVLKFLTTPQNFNTTPQNFNITPQNFNTTPQNFNTTPQNFNITPQNFNITLQAILTMGILYYIIVFIFKKKEIKIMLVSLKNIDTEIGLNNKSLTKINVIL